MLEHLIVVPHAVHYCRGMIRIFCFAYLMQDSIYITFP